MPVTDSASVLPAQISALASTAPKLFTSLLRANQSCFQSLVTFNLRQAENVRLASDAFLSDVQPLLKTANPTDALRVWLEMAEKQNSEVLKRFRDSVDDLREQWFKALEQAVDDAVSDAEEPASPPRRTKAAAKVGETADRT